ncbi:MAG TPA: hypothetical protein VH575_28295 [Gemmataceae bacterium]
MILLVVLCLLTLFAILGLAFVLYADASRESARLYRESETQTWPDVDAEMLLSHFLGQLLFDAADDETGVYSALRGHSLARLMYGYNDAAANTTPFNGTGRQHGDSFYAKSPLLPDDSPVKDDYNFVNYTYFARDGFLRDPERRGWRPSLRDNRQPFASGFNAPYTYPDLNNMFLAAVKADGTVLLPSFHRPWTGFGSLDPSNSNWRDASQPRLKYLVLRPRPADMGPGFPIPEDAGGDVKNLIGGPGGNDSIWIDLDFPIMKGPDGQKFKPLFAPLIVDLDNRVNLNVHGNLRGVNYANHASHQGWGPWEVNPRRLVTLPDADQPGYADAQAKRLEWNNLLSGFNAQTPGRYGTDRAPHSNLPGNLASGPLGRYYAPVDFDGSRELPTGPRQVVGRPSAQLRLPGSRRTLPYQCFPTVPPKGGYGNNSPAELANHPLLYNPFRPAAPDHAFAPSDLEALLRYGDTGSAALTSELMRLCPRNFVDPADAAGSARRRRLVTVASFDPDRPGVTPWFWSQAPGDVAYNRLPPINLSSARSSYYPSAGSVSAPTGTPPPFESEFGPDGRAAAELTALRRLDLNRYLPDYPNPDPQTGRIADTLGFTVAQTARQHMAAEIFEVLWRVTGCGDPSRTPPPGMPGYIAARWDALWWMAQLAVNIVDFIDADDYLTPFNWFTDPTGRQEWVYGTELPRVLLNEAYVEYTNVPDDFGLKLALPHATKLKGNVWVELYNSFQDDPPLTAPYRNGMAKLEMPATGALPGYGIYQLKLVKLSGSDIRQADNVRGDNLPPGSLLLSTLSGFSAPSANGAVDTRVLLPADMGKAGGYCGPERGNQGFYLLGPLLGEGETNPFPASLETLRRPEMSYVVNATNPESLNKYFSPSLLWQRLACPYLPPQPNPLLPLYNPYITVDYMREVQPNYAAAVGVNGPPPAMPTPQPVAQRSSVGRKQPYAANGSQLNKQQPMPALTDQPQHTFFQHNADSTTPGPNWRTPPPNYPPFEWLVHLDRQLISPMELLHVSAFKPHELTQQFRTGDTNEQKFNHRAPWLDEDLVGSSTPQSHRLYRALEFLGTHSRILGMMTAGTRGLVGLPQTDADPPYLDQQVVPLAMSGTSANGGTWQIDVGCTLVIDRGLPSEEVVRVKAVGPSGNPTWFTADFLKPHGPGFTIAPTTVSERVPGKINLNTVWDAETFVALCDPNSSNGLREEAVTSIFAQLRASRTVAGQTPGPKDRPFRGLAAGLSPAGYSEGWLQDTLLRFKDPGDPHRLPILAGQGRTHPYQTFELLTKIFNNVTVRSNVFAVWLTVGFFEVTDDTTKPVKLGAEVGRAEGRNIRHRMFAIVDRSVLTGNPGPQSRFDPRALPRGFATGMVVPYVSLID